MTAIIEDLIAKRRYKEALRVAREEAQRHPGDHELLTLCADIFLLLRKEQKAVDVLTHVANLHAFHGSPAKAVAALKKIQRISRDDTALYESIATRIEQERTKTLPGTLPTFTLPKDDETTEPAEEIRVIEDAVVDQAVTSPLFDDFSRLELLAFMKGLQLHVFDPGDVIVAQGEAGDSLFILTTGIVKAFVRDRENRHKFVRTMHDGDFFGEISILSGSPRTATITAATRCELLELDREALDAITRTHPRVWTVMQKFCDERLASDAKATN